MLEVVDVSKTYAGTTVLQPTSFAIDAGQTLVLIGPSGCGKSTLLRILIGLIPSDSGCVKLGGQEITEDNVLAMRHAMGYVLQDGGLFPHLSVRENVTLLARYLRKMNSEEIVRRVEELADLTKLPREALDRFPSQLSGGQRQRVAIMRALMLDPPVLLLDEPMGALDPLVRYDLQEDLRQIFRTLHKTVVLVTHDLGEAAFFGEDVMLMSGGRIVQRGALAEFFQNPAEEFVTRFITAQRLAR